MGGCNLKNRRYVKDKFSGYDFSIEDLIDNNVDEDYLEEISNKTCVYIQYTSDLKKFYVGESNRYISDNKKSRFIEHLIEDSTVSGNINHNEFDRVLIVISKHLNANGVILETKLLKYMDTEFLLTDDKTLVNSRKNQDYAEGKSETIELELFPELWNFLKELKFVKSDLENVAKNPIIYYSPFDKKLDNIQEEALNRMVEIGMNENRVEKLLIQGEPGTGKTFITASAIFELVKNNKKVAIIVNQKSMSKIYTDLFKLFDKNNKPFVGSLPQFKNALDGKQIKIDDFSLIIVDEAHRLKQPQGKHNFLPGTYALDRKNMDLTEIDIIESYNRNLVLMYDEFQLIRDSDIDIKKFKERVNSLTGYEEIILKVQYRIKSNSNIAAENYTRGLRNILQLESSEYDEKIFNNGYTFDIVDSLDLLVEKLGAKTNASYKHARILSGFYKEWKSNKDSNKYEWEESKYGINLKWNTPNNKLGKKNWLKYTSDNNLELKEVGCIHIAQGMDLDYAGVIIGEDLDITEDSEGNLILFGNSNNYHDEKGIPIKGTDDGSRLTEYIKKVYYILLSRGIHGTFVYIENPKVKKYFKELTENKTLV